MISHPAHKAAGEVRLVSVFFRPRATECVLFHPPPSEPDLQVSEYPALQ
jgi:hypothetical protein